MLKKILFSLFIVALSLSLVACGKKVSKDEYDAVVAQLEAKGTELTAKIAELEAKKTELNAKIAELVAKNEEIADLSDELAEVTAELEDLTAELEALRKDVGDRTFVHDGVFTAFEATISGGPQIVSVSVIIKNDQISGFFIDTLQSTAIKNGEGATTGYTFNLKTKKQLGYEYYMFPDSEAKVDGVLDVEAYKAWLAENNKKEWFEQANLLEQYMLVNGVDSVEFNGTKASNVTGVTITANEYVAIAKKAIQNAKDGILTAVTGYEDDVIWATAKIDVFGRVSDYKIDVLQGNGYKDGAFTFKEKSKQQLGYEYYMFPDSEAKVDGVLDVEAYKTWLAANGKKEWFEQVAILCAEFEANGGYNFLLENNRFSLVSGVTIQDNKYIQVLNQVKANAR
jgi:hypothetical protein